MFTSIAKSLFGDSNERVLKKFHPVIEQINSLEQKIEALDKMKLLNFLMFCVNVQLQGKI